ncbi:MAG TPA: glycosyltransferase [Gemmatimonadaceae bacterium]
MFGLRGLRPDREISGFETAFSEIAPSLVDRGHRVTIYCRAGAHSPSRRPALESGVELIYTPSPGGKNFSALTSTGFAVAHALAKRTFDVWFFVNVGMGHHSALARLSGRPVVMNVDGLDWKRGKWGPVARAYFYSAAHSAVRWCTTLITDAEAMREHYREEFGRDSVMIPYGATIESSTAPELLAPFGVGRHEYYLIVSRLIPENTLESLLDGFRRSASRRRLLVVGAATYQDDFQGRLRALAASDERIRLVGLVHDQAVLKELWCNCYGYLHGHSVGGTNPALLRAMGYGACVLARDTVFNREVLGHAGDYFDNDPATVARLIDELDTSPARAEQLRIEGRNRVRALYRWEDVASAYERVFIEAVERSGRRRLVQSMPVHR